MKILYPIRNFHEGMFTGIKILGVSGIEFQMVPGGDSLLESIR